MPSDPVFLHELYTTQWENWALQVPVQQKGLPKTARIFLHKIQEYLIKYNYLPQN